MKRSPPSGLGRVGPWLCVLLVGAGCPADAPRADGAACASDAECASGLCYLALCLDPDGDDDGDGLTNAEERAIGSDPTRVDTDGDGLADAVEVGPDVTAPRDSDGDGKPDVLESAIADADLDCINDQFDPEDSVPETDLAVVARIVCRTAGPCAPPGLVTASCLRVDADGVLGSRAVCDYGAVPGYEGNVELSCDGIDNDCDGRVDEDLGYLEPGGELRAVGEACAGTGACAELAGVVECSAEREATCSVNRGGSEFEGSEVDIDCDRVDNDCDGRTDDGVAWLEPGTGAIRLSGESCVAEGVCGLTLGVVECAPGTTEGICSTQPGASDDQGGPEVCDGADNDCDGETDEGIRWRDGSGRSLTVGASCGLGACAGGVVVCGAGGGATCSSLVRSTGGLERCDGIDDDCDGVTDEAEGLALGCPTVGVCEGLALRRAYCDEDGLVCEFDPGHTYRPGPERWCDGRDDNCDGATDEGFATDGGLPLGAPCEGRGACAGTAGVVVCSPGGQGAVCSADLAGTVEVCNGVDDDCDGTTDLASADLPGGGVCAVLGVCAAWVAVEPACVAGSWGCGYADDPLWEAVETRCDGLDNDCDGLTDAGLRRLPSGAVDELAAAQPGPRVTWPIAAAGGDAFLFGGLGGGPSGFGGADDGAGAVVLGDLWRYDQATHAWTALPAEGGPGPRVGHGIAWEPTHGVLLVHGGVSLVAAGVGSGALDAVAEAPLGDLFVYDPAVGGWAMVAQQAEGIATGALARRDHALGATGGGRVVLHGGRGASAADAGAAGDLPVALAPIALAGHLQKDATGDGEASWSISWQALAGAPARVGHRLVAAGDGGAFLVGGVDPGVGGAADATRVYRWGGEAGDPWIAAPGVAPGGPAWWSPGAALDGSGRLVVVAEGGSWRLGDDGAWQALSGLSDEARGAVVVTDAGEVRLVDVGTGDAGGRATWRLAGAVWQGASRWAGPEPRLGATLVAHPGGWGTWLFGGTRGQEGPALGDVWRLDPATGAWEAEALASAPWEAPDDLSVDLVGALGVWDDLGERFVLVDAASQLWSYAPGSGALAAFVATGDGPNGERVRALAVDGAGGVWCLGEAASGALALRRLDLADASWTKRWDAASGAGPQQLGVAVAAGVADGRLWLVSASAAGVVQWSYDLGLDAWSAPVAVALAPWGIDPSQLVAPTWDGAAGAMFAFVADPAAPRLMWFDVAAAEIGAVGAPWARRGMAAAVDPVHGVVGYGGFGDAAAATGARTDTLKLRLACPVP